MVPRQWEAELCWHFLLLSWEERHGQNSSFVNPKRSNFFQLLGLHFVLLQEQIFFQEGCLTFDNKLFSTESLVVIVWFPTKGAHLLTSFLIRATDAGRTQAHAS